MMDFFKIAALACCAGEDSNIGAKTNFFDLLTV